MKKGIIVFLLSIFIFSAGSNVFAQSTFPQGSTNGTMQMNPNVSPVQIPNLSIQITEPQTGKEVAFSVRLLLLLTILTLAPSILIHLFVF